MELGNIGVKNLDNESSNEKLVDLVRAMVLYNKAVKNAG